MDPREKLFNEFMNGKSQMQYLAGIVQNPIEISEKELAAWSMEFDEFIEELKTLRFNVVSTLDTF